MMGFLYTHIMDVQKNFMMFVVASGAGNTNRTGKSLMTSMWQLLFNGKKTTEGTMSISEAEIFRKLDKGTPIYSESLIKFYDFDRGSKQSIYEKNVLNHLPTSEVLKI